LGWKTHTETITVNKCSVWHLYGETLRRENSRRSWQPITRLIPAKLNIAGKYTTHWA